MYIQGSRTCACLPHSTLHLSRLLACSIYIPTVRFAQAMMCSESLSLQSMLHARSFLRTRYIVGYKSVCQWDASDISKWKPIVYHACPPI